MHSCLLISLITLAVLSDFSALRKTTAHKKDLMSKADLRHILYRKILPAINDEESSDASELEEKFKAEDAGDTEESMETEEKVKKEDTDELEEKIKTEEIDKLGEKIKKENAHKAIPKDVIKVIKSNEDKKDNKIAKKIDKVKGDGEKVKGIKEKSTNTDSSEDAGGSSASSMSGKPKGECAKVGTSRVCLSEDGKSLIVTDKKVKPVIFMTENDSGNSNPIKESASDETEAGSGGGAGGKEPGAAGVAVGKELGSGGAAGTKGASAKGNSFSISTGTGGDHKVAVSSGNIKPNIDVASLTDEIKKGIMGKVPGLGAIAGGLAGASGSSTSVSTSGGKGSIASAVLG